MTVLHGTGVGRGGAVGPVVRVRPSPVVTRGAADAGSGRAAAADAAVAALRTVADELDRRATAAGGAIGDVLVATAAMARDAGLAAAVRERALAGEPPAVAVDGAVAAYADLFAQAGGALAERVTDLASIRDRVVARLLDLPEPGAADLTEPSVVVASDLSPADLAGLDLGAVLAVVLQEGGPTGHTAIIARELGIPCVVRVAGADALTDGRVVAVDAATGEVHVDPGDDVRVRVAARRTALAALAERGGPGATADGHRVALLANIGTADDAARLTEGAGADATDAPGTAVEGVGLFRTEVAFLDRTTAPDEAEQANLYARVLAALGGRPVVVRTFDAGADKPLGFATGPCEPNPALGVRGYRVVRTAEAVLRTQLAALAAAAERTGVDPWVMAPMVATPEEAARFAALARAVGLRHVGVMVEVPAAALRARDVLAEVDFVSIGTNDLAQYTMAADRGLAGLADLLDPWQPALLDLVAATAQAAAAAGKPAGVCGESAADPLLALVLTGLGVSSLSMAPAAVPAVRYALARHTREQCVAMGAAARAARTASDARAAVVGLADAEVCQGLALG